ncbi:Aldo/keto reductase [Atractiella rhizophila]|nr:Aldo/keto reductase [Atractiella rhizophila]
MNAQDTAYVYAPGAPTSSEALLGQWKAAEKGWKVDTKANYALPNAHNLENLRNSLESSLKRLNVSKVRTFYLHHPERSTPLLEQLRAIDVLHKEGKFEKFGVSNFHVDEVEELIRLSQEHNLVKVSVYQGQYNGLARNVESQLFPVLQKHNISFFAYSPTAGGFFQEKHILDESASGRFAGDSRLATAYRSWFHKPAYFSALKEFHSTLKAHPNSPTASEVATRWLVYHSALKGEKGDAVILGTSRKSHLEEGLEWVEKGPLDGWILEAMEKLWERVKDVAPFHAE